MQKTDQPAGSQAAPPSRTAAARAPKEKILRACVVQGGRVLDEQRLKLRQPLTIGTGPKNIFVINHPSLPRTHTLFVNKGGAYELVFTESMRGKISIHGGGAPLDFAQIRAQGIAKKKGDTFHLPLTENHRGKIMLGDATLIFQFVVPPPQPARAKLPAAARGSFWKSLDWPYFSALFAIALVEAPIVITLQFVDPPKEITLDQVDSRFASLIIPDYKPVEEKNDKAEEKGKAVASTKKEAKAKKAGPESEEAAAKAKAARSAEIRKSINNKGILGILGTAGEGSASGAVADVFGSGSSLDGDLDSAFEGISGVGVATTGGMSTTRGGGSGEAATIGGLATAGGGEVGLQGKAERKVGAVKAAAPEVDGSLDSNVIARYVRGRMRSIQDCYEKELKRDPSLAGKIEIEFTISESGDVEDASVVTNQMGSDAVGNCIISRVKRWRFPKPDGGSVTVSYPFIFTASGG
jgi:TonB family protein